MDINKQFSFLIKEYGLKYEYQEFRNCYGGNGSVFTHSFYNESGCFTIHDMPSRGELEFYYAKRYSTIHKELYEQMIDVSSIEKEIWNKYTRFLFFSNPFFWWRHDKVLNVLAKVLKVHIVKYGDFFGIRIINKKNQE